MALRLSLTLGEGLCDTLGCTLLDDVFHVHPLHPVRALGVLGLGGWCGIQVPEASPAASSARHRAVRGQQGMCWRLAEGRMAPALLDALCPVVEAPDKMSQQPSVWSTCRYHSALHFHEDSWKTAIDQAQRAPQPPRMTLQRKTTALPPAPGTDPQQDPHL